MTAKELFTNIVEDLQSDPYLYLFKFTKSNSKFSIQDGDVRKSIELEHWSDLDELVIRPTYGVKFNVLNDWFSKYNFYSKADQKANDDVFFGEIEGLTRASWNQYVFQKDGSNYEEAISLLKTDLINCSKFVFCHNDTLDKLYKNEVEPILNGTRKLGVKDIGANWIFRYLRLCRLVKPESYPLLKDKLIEHFEFMKSREEPNVLKYADKIEEIIATLESI